jgi:hypothetical protein
MKKSSIVFILIGLFIIAIIFARLNGLVVTSINSCMDTDGGKNYTAQGRVEGVYYLFLKEDFSEQDYCENDSKTLVEYYCSLEGMHSYKGSVKYECKLGCRDGKCIEGIAGIEERPVIQSPGLFSRIVAKIKGFFRS